jgi:antitoxin MazE
MKAHVKTWGNSLAIRIPKVVAEQLKLAPDSEVELTITDGVLIVQPHRKEILSDLLAGITPENLHPEMQWGPDRGREVL